MKIRWKVTLHVTMQNMIWISAEKADIINRYDKTIKIVENNNMHYIYNDKYQNIIKILIKDHDWCINFLKLIMDGKETIYANTLFEIACKYEEYSLCNCLISSCTKNTLSDCIKLLNSADYTKFDTKKKQEYQLLVYTIKMMK